jgi:hypothetical protein
MWTSSRMPIYPQAQELFTFLKSDGRPLQFVDQIDE